jgi:hypothetical protein
MDILCHGKAQISNLPCRVRIRLTHAFPVLVSQIVPIGHLPLFMTELHLAALALLPPLSQELTGTNTHTHAPRKKKKKKTDRGTFCLTRTNAGVHLFSLSPFWTHLITRRLHTAHGEATQLLDPISAPLLAACTHTHDFTTYCASHFNVTD